jgi:hypothetical protein
MPEFMSSRFNLHVGQFDHLSQKKIKNKKNQSSEFSEVKNQRVKKMYLRGALDSVQFFIA